jgi:hypothetical protein
MGGRMTSGFVLEPEPNTSAIVVLSGGQVFGDVESSFRRRDALGAEDL